MDIADAEDLFRGLADSAPIGIYVAQSGRFRFVNKQFQQLTGHLQDELLDTDPLDIVLPEDRATVREHAISMLKGEISALYEYRIVCKRGESKSIMESVAPIQYDGQRATLGYFMDVTRLKVAEQEVRYSELRYRTVVETSPDAIVFLVPMARS
jgi:PAS domain S-box-containing protein